MESAWECHENQPEKVGSAALSEGNQGTQPIAGTPEVLRMHTGCATAKKYTQDIQEPEPVQVVPVNFQSSCREVFWRERTETSAQGKRKTTTPVLSVPLSRWCVNPSPQFSFPLAVSVVHCTHPSQGAVCVCVFSRSCMDEEWRLPSLVSPSWCALSSCL